MASLFQLPKVVSLPGSKLYFYRTGTSTPQDVFTDEDLTIAHSNPVVADAAGVFEPIYLAQTDYNYRVSHYTSADVLIYTVDDIPNKLGDGRNLTIESVTPFLELFDTDGPSNAKRVQLRQQGGDFELVILNDAGTVVTSVFKIFRTGANPDELRFLCDDLTAVVDGVNYKVALTNSDSFTGTLTGMSASTTGTVFYRKVNNVVTLWVESDILGTSNSTAMTMTGLHADVQATGFLSVPCILTDNSQAAMSALAIVNGSTITFRLAKTDAVANYVQFIASGFTASGSKGISSGWTITYTIPS